MFRPRLKDHPKYLIHALEERTFLELYSDRELINVLEMKARRKECKRDEAWQYFDVYRRTWLGNWKKIRLVGRRKGK